MELTYKIPFGTMAVHADAFFRDGGRRQIRKLLKDYKASCPDQDEVDQLKTWLQEQIKEEGQKQEQSSKQYQDEEKQLRILEWNYRRCQAYGNNKEQCKSAKEEMRACKANLRLTSSKRKAAQQAQTRYCRSLEDINLIFF